jgi:zinc transporter ZupT
MFQLKNKDKEQVEGLRREFTPRNFLGRLLARFGGLFIVAGVCSPLYAHSSAKSEFWTAASMVVFGLLLGICAALLVKPSFTQNRPLFWLPAISGLMCSSFVIVLTGCFLFTFFTPKKDIPDWIRYALFLSAGGGLVSATVCIATAISAIRKARAATPLFNQPTPPP